MKLTWTQNMDSGSSPLWVEPRGVRTESPFPQPVVIPLAGQEGCGSSSAPGSWWPTVVLRRDPRFRLSWLSGLCVVTVFNQGCVVIASFILCDVSFSSKDQEIKYEGSVMILGDSP